MGSKSKVSEEKKGSNNKNLQKSYFDVLGLCCSSEVPLIEKILKPLEGVVEVSVIVPSRTVIVLHDITLITPEQIAKTLNQARLEANVRVNGKANYKAKWPSPYVMLSGLCLALSFLKYVYHPMQWLALAAVVAGVWPILLRGAIALRNFTVDVNILMLIAVISTIAMKDYTEAGTIVFLFTIAEWLESRASQKATAVMSSLLSMAPQKATIAETGEVVNVEDVKLNTVVAVKSGEMIPVDGVVVNGTCEVDEKTLTGESYPVPKQKDSIVWAGTMNVNGYVSVKTTALAEDSAVAKMARLVEEAQNSRSNVQRLIDRCAKYYTPAVVLISLGLAVVPVILKVHNLKHWFYLALVVLVSACPCGLILSTPVATFCALSRAATSGLLIKGGDYLETLAKIKTIGFDKTGTITRGEFTLMTFQTLADDVGLNTLVYWVSSIESKSSHPIASVLVDYGRSQSIEPKPENVKEFQNFPGEGVFGIIDGRNLYIGNKKLAERAKCNIASNVRGDTKEGATSGYVYSEGVLIGTFSLSDNCRSGAVEAIRELKAMGIRTALLTGDNQAAAMRAQEQLGHALDFVHSELLPENKASIIKDYKKHGPTAMVGDGVNDAPALATADIGISMGVSGSALATETGHVVLMSNDIRKIPKAIKLARKARRKVIENIFISLFTKACVLASAFAWHPLVWLAVLADVLTCLIVIFNSMLLLRGGHDGHKHGRKWFGLFSCHSHKSNKCHSTGHQHHQHSAENNECCSKNAPPCPTSSKCHTVKDHNHAGSCLEKATHNHSGSCQRAHTVSESSRCLLQDGSISCHTSDEHAPKCAISNSPKSMCKSTGHQHSERIQQCCSKNAPQKRCESGSPCQTSSKCHTAKNHAASRHNEPNTISESSRCLLKDCSSSCHTSNEHVPECSISDIRKKEVHEYHRSTCCQEDHYLEALESQISCDTVIDIKDEKCCGNGIFESDKHETLPECQHNGHGHEQKICCKDIEQKSLGHQKVTDVSGCTDHCATSLEIHGEHHHSVDHGTCHAKKLASDCCTSLRTREVGACCQSYRKTCCSSQDSFVAGFGGGLTEIVTE